MRPAWVVLGLALAGCGYRFTAGGAPLPEGVRTVCAPVFLNRTAEPGVEVAFTQAMRERLARAGVLGAKGSCDAELEGEVLAIASAPTVLTNTAPAQLASYRLTSTARLRLAKGGRVLSETQLSGFEDYLPGTVGDVLQAEAQRQAALQRLAGSLMRDGYERLATGW